MSADLEKMVAEGRADHQLALVREHWASVRWLWLAPEPLKVARLDGLPPDFWVGCGMPGMAPVRQTRGDRFEFAKDGRPAVIVPAYDTIPGNLNANPAAHVEHLVDLVAVDLDHPDRHWRRRGEAVVLGNAFLEIAGQEGEPVPMFKNPISWLRSGGAGIAILDWGCARDLLLDHELVAENIEIGERLEMALKPDIWVIGEAA